MRNEEPPEDLGQHRRRRIMIETDRGAVSGAVVTDPEAVGNFLRWTILCAPSGKRTAMVSARACG